MKRKIFIPGSFSPFHDGHYTLIEKYLNDNNNEIILVVSAKNRDGVDTTNMISLLYKIFKNKNVTIIKSEISPIKWIYENTIEDDNVIYSIVRSDKNGDNNVCDSYYNAFSKDGKFYSDKIKVEKLNEYHEPVKYKKYHDDYISGTMIRNDARNKNFDAFCEGYEYMLTNNILSINDINDIYRTIF
jgi:nicotinamide mononucleotide adenylyltransferase